MTSKNCELCSFKNPKGVVTAAIIQDNKVLTLKRAEEPYKGMWDFPGGYMQGGETPEAALTRELKEELGVHAKLTLGQYMPGTAEWKGEKFFVINGCFLADIGDQEIRLDAENSEYTWMPLKTMDPEKISFDSNKEFAKWIKKEFVFDLDRVKELIRQLDSTAILNEQALYKAMLNGFVSRRYDDGGTLIGLGWIFPRQTALRKQAVVEDMIVDASYRGKGLGREILRDLLRWARENKCDMVELTTNPKRLAANELYKSEGFWLHPTNHYLYTVVK